MFSDPNNPYNNYSNLQDARFSKEIDKLGLKHTFSSNYDNNTVIDDKNFEIPKKKDTAIFSKKHIYSIDSRNRNTNPHNLLTGKNIYLPNNALSFTAQSSSVTITANNHGLTKGKKIILQNVKSTIYQSKGGIELINGSSFVKITQEDHGLGNIISDDTDYEIKITGLEGNNNKYTFGDIPISLINNKHKVYLFSDSSSLPHTDYYFIKLDVTVDIDTASLSDTSSNIIIEHKNLYGIPLNYLNVNYPLDQNQLFSDHVVEEIIDNNTISINLKDMTSKITGVGGGNNMYISTIKSVIEAYPHPNRYKININNELFKVGKIKILSTLFPNNAKTIVKDYNNKLYWEDLYNSGHIYEIALDTGKYEIPSLISAIEKKINKTEVMLLGKVTSTVNQTTATNSQFFSSDVSIDRNTSIVTFKFYKKLSLNKGIYKLNYSSIADSHIRIKVIHPNHDLLVGDEIIISGAIDTDAIPSSVLNTTHQIEKVVDNNSYQIKLPLFNASTTTEQNFGGTSTIIKIPVKVRMFFDKSDTMGKILGFTRVGEKYSVTPFEYSIANNKPYANDILKDSTGRKIKYDATTNTIQNNDLFLNDTQYIIMTCSLLENQSLKIVNSNIKNPLCKLIIKQNKYNSLDDIYTPLVEYLDRPIDITTDIEFGFYNIDGSLHDFYGRDHSFVIEFTEIINTLNNGLYDTNHGISNINHYRE